MLSNMVTSAQVLSQMASCYLGEGSRFRRSMAIPMANDFRLHWLANSLLTEHFCAISCVSANYIMIIAARDILVSWVS